MRYSSLRHWVFGTVNLAKTILANGMGHVYGTIKPCHALASPIYQVIFRLFQWIATTGKVRAQQ